MNRRRPRYFDMRRSPWRYVKPVVTAGKYAYDYSSKYPEWATAGLAYAVGPPGKPSSKPSKSKRSKRSRYKRHKKPPLVSINDKLKKLAKVSDASTGNLTYRNNICYKVEVAENLQNVTVQGGASTSNIEGALAFCKFFNPALPGTLTTADLSTGTYQRNVLVNNISEKLIYRNNYQVPCDLKVYLCRVKDDTSQNPLVCWDAAVPDASNLTDSTDLNQYPSDYNLLNDLWNITKICDIVMQPGDMKEVNHSTGQFEYDPATVDVHSTSYQKEYKAYFIMTVIKGVVAHDSTVTTEQGLIGAALDVERRRVYNIEYNAGTNIRYTQVSNTYDTFTNGSLVSNKPVSDNQAYSIA